jgi:hypothetical protein
MTWDDILIEKIFDKLAYIIPALRDSYCAIYFAEYPTLSSYIVTVAMIIISGNHMDDYCFAIGL